MNTQIWKFGPLYPGHKWVPIDIDEFAEFRHFGFQGSRLFFWAEVNPEAGMLAREFMVIPTGVNVPKEGIYHATAIAPDLTVWHLYERA